MKYYVLAYKATAPFAMPSTSGLLGLEALGEYGK